MKKCVSFLFAFVVLIAFSLTIHPADAAAPTQTPSPTPLPVWTPAPGAKTITLKADGSGDFATLPEALDSAAEGDQIILEKGTYTLKEPLTITKGVTIIGAGAEETTINLKTNSTGITYSSKSSKFAIRSLTLNQDAPDQSVLEINNGYFNIFDVKVSNRYKKDCVFALNINDYASGIIQDSTITKTCTGIGINTKGTVTIEHNNILQNSGTGVYIDGDSEGYVFIRDNEFQNNYQGVMVSNRNTLIDNNDFSTNNRGIAFASNTLGRAINNRLHTNMDAFHLESSADPIIEGNVAYKNCWGLFAGDNTVGTFHKNRFDSNMVGIQLQSGASPEITENTLKGNRVGIFYAGNSQGRAYKNTITDSVNTGEELYGAVVWLCGLERNAGMGIAVEGEAIPLLDENIIRGSSASGIIFKQNAGGTARRNELHENQIGLSVVSMANPQLEDNIVSDNKQADVSDVRVGAVVKISPTPAPTADPISIIEKSLADVIIEKKDAAEYLKTWGVWQKPNKATLENGMVKLTGVKDDYQGFINPILFRGNTGVMFQFTRKGNKETTIGFDRGNWGTDNYKSYDISLFNGEISAYYYKGNGGDSLDNPARKFVPKSDTIYNLLMVMTEDGQFLTKVWEPTKPEKGYTNYFNNKDASWKNFPWTFRFRIYGENNTINIRDYAEVTFSRIKGK